MDRMQIRLLELNIIEEARKDARLKMEQDLMILREQERERIRAERQKEQEALMLRREQERLEIARLKAAKAADLKRIERDRTKKLAKRANFVC